MRVFSDIFNKYLPKNPSHLHVTMLGLDGFDRACHDEVLHPYFIKSHIEKFQNQLPHPKKPAKITVREEV